MSHTNDAARGRKRLYQMISLQRILVGSIGRTVAAQTTANGPKVSAANAVVEETLQYSSTTSDITRYGSTVNDVSVTEGRPQSSLHGTAPKVVKLNKPHPQPTAFEIALNAGSAPQAKRKQRPPAENQGGGKGMRAQTGKFVNSKPNNGRLPAARFRKSRQNSDSSPGYQPADDSTATEATPPRSQRKKQKKKERRSERANTETDAVLSEDDADDIDFANSHEGNREVNNSEHGSGEDDHNEDGDSSGGNNDSNADDSNDEDDESSDGGQQNDDPEGLDDGDTDQHDDSDQRRGTDHSSDSESADLVELPKVNRRKLNTDPSVPQPPIPTDLPGGFCELPKTFIDDPEQPQPVDTEDYSNTDDDGNDASFGTQLQRVHSGVTLDSDDADEDYVSDDTLAHDDPRKVVILSKRAKYYTAMMDQSMKPFYRIRRHDEHEKGCYLTLGNPPNTFHLSDSLRKAAEEEATEVFDSYEPFTDKSKGREVRFKEKVWNANQGCKVKARLGPVGVAVAETMHKYTSVVLTAMLKTASLGSTFFEAVNQCSFAKSTSASMMLRSQVDPYRTTLTAAFSFAKDLYDAEFDVPMPKKMQRTVVMEVICRIKGTRKSRVNSHKVDDHGVKIELAKRKQRNEAKDSIDFE